MQNVPTTEEAARPRLLPFTPRRRRAVIAERIADKVQRVLDLGRADYVSAIEGLLDGALERRAVTE